LDISIELAGNRLSSPLVLSSGCAGYAYELEGIVDFSCVGAVVLKSVTPEPRVGNPYPRIWEVTGGILNSIGLENVGLECLLREVVPLIKELEVPVIASIASDMVKGYANCASRLEETGAFIALELNISCPNVEKGGLDFGSDPTTTAAVVKACKGNSSLPIFAKLSAAVTGLSSIAFAAAQAGADGLSLINTIPGLAVDAWMRKPRLGAITGGLSGPAIKPIALKAVWDCYRATGLPIIGGGGVYDVEDVIEFMICGATAVSLGTVLFNDPRKVKEIAGDLPGALERLDANSLSEIVGTLRV